MSEKVEILLKYLKIDVKELENSATLDDYICKMVDKHIKKEGYDDYDDFIGTLESKGTRNYQLDHNPVKGLTVELLERWMDKLAPPMGK